jgi:SAM-dependent MidA family methyltransferase
MEMCLYDREFGYYMKERPVIGKLGDYYTSPHIDPLFGALVASQIEEMWELIEKPPIFTIAEFGPGEGRLCRDIIHYLRLKKSPLLSGLRYRLIELNPYLKLRQKALLNDYAPIVSHLDALEAMDYGCVLANEVLDAFPVCRVEFSGGQLREIGVELDGERLTETALPANEAVKNYFETRNVFFSDDYRTEVNFRMQHWISAISRCILKEGFSLTIDYGYSNQEYYSPERNQGALLCYHKHRVTEDFFNQLGDQDMTGHVNFSDLKRWGEAVGLSVIGFTSLLNFLLGQDLAQTLATLGMNEDAVMQESGKIKRLLLETGQSHSVMIQYKGLRAIRLKGFSMRNQIKLL